MGSQAIRPDIAANADLLLPEISAAYVSFWRFEELERPDCSSEYAVASLSPDGERAHVGGGQEPSQWERHRSYPEPDGGVVWFPHPVFDRRDFYTMKGATSGLATLTAPPEPGTSEMHGDLHLFTALALP
jgi:hypothetical protein